MTPLEKTLKRELRINGRDYVVTLSPDALKFTEKGHRLGLELPWADLISGDSALAIALQASVGRFPANTPRAAPRRRPATKHPRSTRRSQPNPQPTRRSR
jgi:hypothetical protein